jgi:exodeoxyribonuclease VII large subunit
VSDLPVVKVSDLNNYMARLIAAQSVLAKMRVEGELANVRHYRSGHWYFSLRDENSTVSCVMFKGQASSLEFKPQDGQKVVVLCRAGFYERDGKFQLYVQSMREAGLGDLYEAYAKLQKKLEKEGLFDPRRKQPLPRLPRRIGVVTSPSGAVIRDIINVLTRRWPGFSLLLFPCQVQGPGAAVTIQRGIDVLNERGDCDVIIVGRGGGSMEDLWAFNDEQLARTIAASRTPVISAVGHETDFTIADFVADMRAPTPSAAAELAVPVKEDMIMGIMDVRRRLEDALVRQLESAKKALSRLESSPYLNQPIRLLEGSRQRLDQVNERMSRSVMQMWKEKSQALATACHRLDALSPLKVLARGYGLVTTVQGEPLTSVQSKSAVPGSELDIILADGRLRCEVTERDSGLPTDFVDTTSSSQDEESGNSTDN